MAIYQHLGRHTYETGRYKLDLWGRGREDTIRETEKILSATCPDCGSSPGDWCEYATGFRPGSFQGLHHSRIKDAGAWNDEEV